MNQVTVRGKASNITENWTEGRESDNLDLVLLGDALEIQEMGLVLQDNKQKVDG